MNATLTNRRGFIATLLAGIGLAKYAKAGVSNIGPSAVVMMESTASGAGDYYRNVFLKSRQLGMTQSYMANMHKNYDQYMKWIKSPEYKASREAMSGGFGGRAKK